MTHSAVSLSSLVLKGRKEAEGGRAGSQARLVDELSLDPHCLTAEAHALRGPARGLFLY